MNRYAQFLKQFPSKRILVVGDVMLDTYVRGEVHRISPEAPVPVLLEHSEESVLGGAGNVAENVRSLGGAVTLFGIIGADRSGAEAKRLCRAHGIRGVFVEDAKRPTPLKMRVVARGHQLVRIDRESSAELAKSTEAKVIAALRALPPHDFAIISDYHKGAMTKEIVRALEKKFGRNKIIADIKPEKEAMYHRLFAITPNIKEAHELTGIYADTDRRAESAARILGLDFDSSIVLTRGEHGITVYDAASKRVKHVPSHPRHVYDVTGAGDTVIAALALMAASGASLADAAKVANAAGSIVVGKEGTSTVASEELADYLTNDTARGKLG